MTNQTAKSSNGIWAITSYYNPMCYEARRANYKIFHEHLDVPLLTVEQGHDGCYQLDDSDATKLIQVSTGDVLWQKERLLNLALEALPSDCSKVAWLDCDIIFERKDWQELAIAALSRARLVQLFDYAYYLNRNLDLNRPLGEQYFIKRQSRASKMGCIKDHRLIPKDPKIIAQGLSSDLSSGHAWIMDREVLEKFGFYEASIYGGGDFKFVSAASGNWDAVRESHLLNDREFDYYRNWSLKMFSEVKGRVCASGGGIFHLWHGELADRKYLQRHEISRTYDYDPSTDIAVDEQGCLRWNSDKPALHAAVHDYFRGRREDGALIAV